jgi:hypothetical protein
VDCKEGVKQIRKPNSVCFRCKAKHLPVCIEAPGTAGFHDLQSRFAVAKKKFAAELASLVFVRKLKDGAKPVHVNDSDRAVWQNAPHYCAFRQFF